MKMIDCFLEHSMTEKIQLLNNKQYNSIKYTISSINRNLTVKL